MTSCTLGTYAGVKFHTSTNKMLHGLTSGYGMQSAVRPDRFHSTLLYSRTYLPDYRPWGEIFPSLRGKPTKVERWSMDSTGVEGLVLLYDCEELILRHHRLMQLHSATFDFPSYIPHITLSYDIGDFDIEQIQSAVQKLPDIIIVEEYSEVLSLTAARTNMTKGN